MSRKDLSRLEAEIGHHFKNKDLLNDALTHSSTGAGKNYERLEFLGDRVLALCVAEILFEKFPDEKEGDMAKRLAVLVQGEVLAEIAVAIDLGAFVSFSQAERAGGQINENILSDALEAVLGALYIESGLASCRALIEKLWSTRFETMIPPQHPKTILQEWAQGRGLPLPTDKIVEQKGPDHAPVFSVKLNVQGYDDIIAEGRTRQLAEKEAANIFLQGLKS